MSEPTPTPRSDSTTACSATGNWVTVEFSRTLERELTSALATIAELRERLAKYQSELVRVTKTRDCFIPQDQLTEFERIPAGQAVAGGLITKWENLAEHHAQMRAKVERELSTVKAERDFWQACCDRRTADLVAERDKVSELASYALTVRTDRLDPTKEFCLQTLDWCEGLIAYSKDALDATK